MFSPDPSLHPAPGIVLARGVCRFLMDEGLAPITEYSPATGLRTDVTALTSGGEIWVVECKSSLADFQSDHKWRGYLDWCDRFFFAVDCDFPIDVLPDGQGLILADGFGAEITRPAPPMLLAPARRKAQTLRICRAAAMRLRGQLDPSLSAMMPPARSAELSEDNRP